MLHAYVKVFHSQTKSKWPILEYNKNIIFDQHIYKNAKIIVQAIILLHLLKLASISVLQMYMNFSKWHPIYIVTFFHKRFYKET